MKRISTLLILFAFCLMAIAQGKLTPQAQLSIARQKVKMERKAAHAPKQGMKPISRSEKCIRLVVKVKADGAAETYRQLRDRGAEVLSKLGSQAVISVPIDSIPAIESINGVERIDKGHKGKLKTDITRKETSVSQLNGTTLPSGATAFTGKGVTVCVIDAGIDFQHPAFKDSQGRSRIKCVYMMGDNGGNKFTVNDPEAGTYTFPGSVYDTPELIASLTTDYDDEYHGTHTTAIAAGSISPLGFGGMAPEADIVLIPLNDVEVDGLEEAAEEEYVELALGFSSAYAKQSNQPVVLSASMNSHGRPHDGTSPVTEAIESVSDNLIPVFSAGNEGGYPIHIYKKFTSKESSMKTFLMAMMEDENGEYYFNAMPSVTGYTRAGSEVSFKLRLLYAGMLERWSSEEIKIKLGDEPVIKHISSDDDATLAKSFEGDIFLGAFDNGDGRLGIAIEADGGVKHLDIFELSVSAPSDAEIDLWDDMAGFGGTNLFGIPGYTDGDSNMSAGDWTSTESVVSVGAYCSNTTWRDYDGTTTDTSIPKYDEDGELEQEPDVLNDIAYFSSYGTSFNGVSQPTICAPGVNIVSAMSHYCAYGCYDSNMHWQDYPYMAESGTSMACPVVSGIVALWLQANPDLTLTEIKDVMEHSARHDSFTTKNTERWGYGKIDAAKGIEYILQTYPSAIQCIDYATTHLDNNQLFDLQGRRLTKAPASGIYIKNGKKIVVK